MKEIENNKIAWSALSKDHYCYFREQLSSGNYDLNAHIRRELGDLSGKKIIHLQCNTGADTICLAKRAKDVTGVDLVPENIYYAKKLSKDLGVENARFLEADLMELSQIHKEQYDVVFTSEGVLGWLPDLDVWAKTVRGLLRDDGFFYLFECHPFFDILDGSLLKEGKFDIKYPYFGKEPEEDDVIGGYASEAKKTVTSYYWTHTLSEIINALLKAGLQLEFFNEYPENCFDLGGMEFDPNTRLYSYPNNREKYPMSFSLKATVRK